MNTHDEPEDLRVSDAHLARLREAAKAADDRTEELLAALGRIATAAALIDDDELRELILHLATVAPA